MEIHKLEKYPNYGITTCGKVYNLKRNKEVKAFKGVDGYAHITLWDTGKKNRLRVHRLMAETFIKESGYVNHKDSNKFNNNLDNLEVTTNSENIQHAYDAGAYLSTYKVDIIVTHKETQEKTRFRSLRAAEEALGIDRHRISNILKGKCNNHTSYEFYRDILSNDHS